MSNVIDFLSGDMVVTHRAPSRSIWGTFPWRDIKDGTIPGIAEHFEMLAFKPSANVNATVAYWDQGFNLYGSDGAAVAVADEIGGAMTFSSDGDNEGVAFQLATLPMQISRAHLMSAFEFRLKTSTITDTKHGLFLGLGDTMTIGATVPIAAAGTLADENFVGFHRLEGDGDQIDTVYKANTVTQVSLQTDVLSTSNTVAGALVADTYVKLGCLYVPRGDRDGPYRLSFYVNGFRLSTSYEIPSADGTDFPNDVRMGPLFALLNATATTPGNTTIDWLRYAQLM